MKKLFLITILALGSLAVQAQEKVIGLRFNNGIEASLQKAAGESNRIELDLGLNSPGFYNVFNISGTYQWTFPLLDVEGLGWYAGPGASFGLWSYDDGFASNDDNGYNISLGGVIGVDYFFADFPLQLSLDTRPMVKVVGRKSYSQGWTGLAVRYIF